MTPTPRTRLGQYEIVTTLVADSRLPIRPVLIQAR
jgi:hypothetical protein